MPERTHCRECGLEFESRDGDTTCPACAIRLALDAPTPPADQTTEPSDADEAPMPRAGESVGRYRLLEEIGRGGMGSVFRAEEREPIRREVAIKFIKWGMDTAQVVARFEAERQALALMDHETIARVLDGGSTHAGRPYFVMEYVRGVPITTFCDRDRLSTEERLGLFMRVCDGVQHAHQKGVIHRDLKPSNVMVSHRDSGDGTGPGERGVPKIIDFGVAKATGGQLSASTFFTRIGQPVGTPAYMSPEQARGDVDIDTRTDVYALGALLYELLVGVAPLADDPKTPKSQEELFSLIEDGEMRRPSHRIKTGDESSESSARARRTDARHLQGRIEGDLDWIVLKALARERAQRYASASELRADIERHLSDQPVLAGPPSVGYRLTKFARRHRAAVGAGLVAGVAVALGLVGLIFGLVRAQTAEARTAREARKTAAINEFLQDVLSSPDPYEGTGTDTTVLQALQAAEDRIPARFADQPDVLAAVDQTLGTTYARLGDYQRARPLLQQALEKRRAMHSRPHPELAESLLRAGWLHRTLNETEQAEAYLIEARETWQALGDDEATLVGLADTLDQIGWLRADQSRFAESTAAFGQALDVRRRVFEPPSDRLASSWHNMASAHSNEGNTDQAIAAFEEALDQRQRVLGPDHLAVAETLGSLARLQVTLGDPEKALEYETEAMRIRREQLPEGHPEIIDGLNTLASIQMRSGNTDLALQTYRELVPLNRIAYGDEHMNVGRALFNYASTLHSAGQQDEARRVMTEAHELNLRLFGPEHVLVGLSSKELGSIELAAGNAARAERLIRQGVRLLTANLGEDHWRSHSANSLLGSALARQRRFEEAESLLLRAQEGLLEQFGEQANQVRRARERLVRLYEDLGRNEESARWQSMIDASGATP